VPRLTFIVPYPRPQPCARPRATIGCTNPSGMAFASRPSKTAPASVSIRATVPDTPTLLPGMVEAFAKLPTQSAILDGELCLIDPRGSAHFYRLMAQMRTSRPDESQLMFLAFDLLHQDGIDLRALPLSERKRDLRRLCCKSRVPFMREVQTFPNGTLLFDHCSKFGFEGVVSKRLASRYSSGPSRNWVKTKCPGWKRIDAERWRIG
jgi:ATP-dependent DNA ligase